MFPAEIDCMTSPGRERDLQDEHRCQEVLENYCFAARNSHTEEEFEGEFEADVKENVVQDAWNWLDKTQWTEKNKFEAGHSRNTVQGRVSERVVPVMVRHQVPRSAEAEKYRDNHGEDKAKIDAKSRLENCCVPVRNTLGEENLADKFEAGDEEKDVQDKKIYVKRQGRIRLMTGGELEHMTIEDEDVYVVHGGRIMSLGAIDQLSSDAVVHVVDKMPGG